MTCEPGTDARRSSVFSCGDSSSSSSSSSAASSRRRSSAASALQKLGRDEADPLTAMGLGGGDGGGGSFDEHRERGQKDRQGASRSSAAATGGSSRHARHRHNRSDRFPLTKAASLSQKAFRVHHEGGTASASSSSSSVLKSAPPSSSTSFSKSRPLGSSSSSASSRPRPASAAPQYRRISNDCTAETSLSSFSSERSSLSLSSSRSGASAAAVSPRNGDGNDDDDDDDDRNLKEIARLKALLVQSQCDLESARTKLSKYSKENRSLRRRVEGYKIEVGTKDERLTTLETEVETLRRGVTDAGQMERANRRMEEEQLRLEGRRLREERDRAIFERNELMSRVGMMGVEVDEPQTHAPGDIFAAGGPADQGGDYLGAMCESSSSLTREGGRSGTAAAVAGRENGAGSRSRRHSSIEDLIHKMGGGGNKISMAGNHASLSGPDLMASMNSSCRKIMVTPESLLWDSDNS